MRCLEGHPVLKTGSFWLLFLANLAFTRVKIFVYFDFMQATLPRIIRRERMLTGPAAICRAKSATAVISLSPRVVEMV